MTTADLNGLTFDELTDHRVTWLKTTGSEQALPEELWRLHVPLLREGSGSDGAAGDCHH